MEPRSFYTSIYVGNCLEIVNEKVFNEYIENNKHLFTPEVLSTLSYAAFVECCSKTAESIASITLHHDHNTLKHVRAREYLKSINYAVGQYLINTDQFMDLCALLHDTFTFDYRVNSNGVQVTQYYCNSQTFTMCLTINGHMMLTIKEDLRDEEA